MKTNYYWMIMGIFFLLSDHSLQAQESKARKRKGSVYMSGGLLAVGYSKSTIHFKNSKTANYDFKLIEAEGTHDPAYSLRRLLNSQYCYRIGYFFDSDWKYGIELNFDHTKYVLKQGQTVRLVGTINGRSYDNDTLITNNFIEYEHTDGANYFMLNFVIQKPLIGSVRDKHALSLMLRPGAGVVIPRTYSKLLNFGESDKYHVSGYLAGIEAGIRFNIFREFFTELSAKGAYANYNDVVLAGNGRAKQDWFSYEGIVTFGFQFNNKKR